MGYTRRQRLLRVELPLAVPLIMAGIRLATVTTIGLATVAAILGESFGGFGFFITEGLNRFFLTEILAGAVLSIAHGVRRRLPARAARAPDHAVGPRPDRAGLMGDIVGWFLDPANLSGPASIPNRLFEHIVLCAAALVTATLIALPIGLYIGHTRRFAGVAINAREHRPGAALVRARRHDPAGVAGAQPASTASTPSRRSSR